MTRIGCRLVCHSPSPHIQQVYTGLSMLHRSGRIELTQQSVPAQPTRTDVAQHLRDATATHARVVIDETIVVHYDMHDAREIDPRDLDGCDCYFKRSYCSRYLAGLGRGAEKVRPFGLNYHVLPDFADLFGVRRALQLRCGTRNRIAALREALDAGNRLAFYARVREFESAPDPDSAPSVLFLASAYDPHDNPERSAAKIEEREHSNETRAACVRLLRKELGPQFFGGFNHNEYTVKRYRDCLVADNAVTHKKNYLRALRTHAICVSTSGLHGSIGWKFAEYIASARAVLQERLEFDAPAGLAAGRNYLEFSTPAQCVEQALRLIADRRLRAEMMSSNASYYAAHLRPDALLLNSLRTAQVSRPGPSASAQDTSHSRS